MDNIVRVKADADKIKATVDMVQPHHKEDLASVWDNLLFFDNKFVVPITIRSKMLWDIHEGHSGIGNNEDKRKSMFILAWNNYKVLKKKFKSVKSVITSKERTRKKTLFHMEYSIC